MEKKGVLKLALVLTIIFLGIFFIIWTTPPKRSLGTIKIWDRNNILLYESTENYGSNLPVKFEQIPKDLINALIVSEDTSFWTNPGVDFSAIIRSAGINLRERKIITGASTITQQLARLNLNEKHIFIRKIREILIALRLTATTPKKEILTQYLNTVYFGRMAYGVQSAATAYFGKDVSNLSSAQAIYLAGIIINPAKAEDRREELISKMSKYNLISAEEANLVSKDNLAFNFSKKTIKAPQFDNYILEKLKDLNIRSGRLNVYTTLDYHDYLLAKDIARLWVTRLGTKHNLSNAALVLIENHTGYLRVMLGGLDGEVNAANSLRQPGSALKPITYAAAFMQNIANPDTLIDDAPKVFLTKKGEGFAPNNYDGKFHGVVTARVALASSLNLPAVEMLSRVGIDNFLALSQKIGLKTLTPNPKFDLALTLGGGEVTLLDLANAYASFAREGRYLPVTAILKITSDDGKILYQHQPGPAVNVLGTNSQKIARQITDIMSDQKARILGFGESNPLVLPFDAAAKTGTTTDWHDNWTVGYTPDFSLGVWVGNNDNSPMIKLTGITGAAPIWNQFFTEFYKDKPKNSFNFPSRPPAIIPNISSLDSPESLEIVYPQNLSSFQSAPLMVSSEAITFKERHGAGIKKIFWVVDGKNLGQNPNWRPVAGEHTVMSIGQTNNNSEVVSSVISFTVTIKE